MMMGECGFFFFLAYFYISLLFLVYPRGDREAGNVCSVDEPLLDVTDM